jgi:hypothetical protein
MPARNWSMRFITHQPRRIGLAQEFVTPSPQQDQLGAADPLGNPAEILRHLTTTSR